MAEALHVSHPGKTILSFASILSDTEENIYISNQQQHRVGLVKQLHRVSTVS